MKSMLQTTQQYLKHEYPCVCADSRYMPYGKHNENINKIETNQIHMFVHALIISAL